MPTLPKLPEHRTGRAQFLRSFGDPTAARLWELAAKELREAMEATVRRRCHSPKLHACRAIQPITSDAW